MHVTRTWVVVLAGGNGERLRAFTERWMGRHVPKQYCTFVGTRSMLEHTLDRACEIAPPERIVTVIARSHAEHAIRRHPALSRGRIVVQPENRDTAPGLFLALTYVFATDQDASVVIFPSDHFVHPERAFVQQVQEALLAALVLDRIVLLGAEPEGLELEYGWIQRGRLLDDRGVRCHAVDRFVEKPARPLAEAIAAHGAVWNTMVMAAPVRALWNVGRRFLPDVIERFEELIHAIRAGRDGQVLDRTYEQMPRRNFSADLLQHAIGDLAVVALRHVNWSDWGTADRIAAAIHALGKRPAFSAIRDSTDQEAGPQEPGALEGAA